MKVNTYTNVAQRVHPISNNNNQPDQYRAVIKKLVKLGVNDWPKFQEQLKKTTLSWNLAKKKKNSQQVPIQLLKRYLQKTSNLLLK